MVCRKEYIEEREVRESAFCAGGQKSPYIRVNNLRQSALRALSSMLGDHRRSFKPAMRSVSILGRRFFLVLTGSTQVQVLGSSQIHTCPGALDSERLVINNQIPCYRMTHLLQRLGSVAVLMMIAIGLVAAVPAEAKKRSAGSANRWCCVCWTAPR